MSSLTKDKVNSTIISMRPAVTQARVHVIHSLSRQIKNLRNKKCSIDKQKEQNERKIKRYVEEIELLKKSSRDSISRYVLITKKTFSDVVRKESKTQKYNMKVRSYVRVSEHAAVKKIMDPFREENPDWERVLPKLIATLGKKTKKRKDVGEVDADQNALVSSDNNDNESDNDNSNENSEDESNLDGGISESENSDDVNENNESDNEDVQGEDLFAATLKQALGKNDTKKETKSVKSTHPSLKVHESRTGDAVVKVLDLNSADSLQEWSKANRMNSSSTDDFVESKRSSFFVGGDSDEEGRDEEDDDQSGSATEEDEVEQRIDGFRNKNFHHKPRDKSFSQSRGSFSNNYSRDQNTRKRKQFQKVTSVKKPKFNKNADRAFTSETTDRNRNKNFSRKEDSKLAAVTSKANISSIKSNSDNKVHPSWEAKQKQKPSIQAFQGKKTVFE